MVGCSLETVGHCLESTVGVVRESPRKPGFIELKKEERIIVLEVFVADNPEYTSSFPLPLPGWLENEWQLLH